MRSLIAALLLPLPFAALPVLSLWLGGGAETDADREYALGSNPGISQEFLLSASTGLWDSDDPGEPLAPIAYTPDGRVMAENGGCGEGRAES